MLTYQDARGMQDTHSDHVKFYICFILSSLGLVWGLGFLLLGFGGGVCCFFLCK